eukprot:Gb_20760 [translate_table: standard]
MQAAVQGGGGPSSSPLSGHDSSKQQLKSDSEHPPSTAYSASGKTKKRDRNSHHSVDSSERDRAVRPNDNDSKRVKRERYSNSNKVEDISNIVDESGGLSNPSGADRLYMLMQQHHDQNDSSRQGTAPVAYRTFLAGVIAATDRKDSLNRFAQLGGLGLLDDWLQEAHRGKNGDGGGSSSKEGDKSNEELLLNLLRALEKLPVDLDSLKSCNAGKSVSNLRGHKNSEIQKKARKLVDAWKKKVDAEMKQTEETKSGSTQGLCWPSCKPVVSNDSSHLLKNGGGSVDGIAKSSGAFVKANGNNNSASLGEVLTKPIPTSMGKTPAFPTSPASIKENFPCTMQSSNSPPAETGGASIADERSSNNQSPSNGLMWSNGASKSAGPNWKEDLKGPVNNVSTNAKNASSRGGHMPNKGILTAGLNGTSKEAGKPLVWSRTASPVMEKSSSMSVTSDKSANESAKIETSSNQRLIVRLPNPGRSPVPNAVADVAAPTIRDSTPERHSSLGLDSFDGKSRSQTVSCIEDARVVVNTRTGGALGSDDIEKPVDLAERGSEEIGRQCRTGEAECHSSESQLSFSSTHYCTAQPKESPPHQQGQPMNVRRQDSLRQSSEKSNGRGLEAENVGICLLACVAADESSRSEKDVDPVAPMKSKNAKDVEPLDKANGLTDSTKPRQIADMMEVQADGDAKYAQETSECHRSSAEHGIHNSEIAAAAGMGQSDENMKPAEEISPEQKSSEKTSEGSFLPLDDRKLNDRQNALCSSPSGKADCNAEEGEFELDPSRGYAAQVEIAYGDASEDKRQVLARSKRNPLDVSFVITGSERYRSSGDDDKYMDEKDDGTRTVAESTFRYPGEDPLEVAMQVAKEVEQEMEKYGKIALERENREANTSLRNSVPSKDYSESQFAKERKQNTIECLNDTEESDLGSQARLDGSFRTENSIVGKAEEGKTEQFECKETNQTAPYPFPKGREHSTCGFDAMDGRNDDPNKHKHAIEEFQHASPSSCPSQSMVCNQVSSPKGLMGPNSMRSRTATPEKTPEVASCPDAEAPERHAFDLNEGIMLDESPQETAAFCYPIPIMPVASTKPAFKPPVSPLRGKGELGWRGSAATSAFRPAEPRRTPDRTPDRCQTATESDRALASNTKSARPLLDFDLNVADEGLMVEDTVAPVKFPSHNSSPPTTSNGQSSARLDLDLNRADESEENGSVLASDLKKNEVPSFSTRSHDSSSGAKPVKHDFDLNDGLIMDEVTADEPVVSRGNLRILGNAAPPLAGYKMGGEMINLTPWSHAGGPFPAVAMPAFASVRPETPFSVAVPQTFFGGQAQAVPSFRADMFRPSAGFSSSTAAAFSYPAQSSVFPYTGFPFGFSSATFPAVSGSLLDSSGTHPFPPGASQILTSSAILPPHVRPPYLMGLTKIPTPSNNDKIWSRPSLDLNAGPDPADAESREERVSVRQGAVLEGTLSLEEQMRVCRQSAVAADSLKRKEPEGGWDLYRPGLKQETWR